MYAFRFGFPFFGIAEMCGRRLERITGWEYLRKRVYSGERGGMGSTHAVLCLAISTPTARVWRIHHVVGRDESGKSCSVYVRLLLLLLVEFAATKNPENSVTN